MSGEHPSGASGAFQLSFAEQIAFFRNKLGNQVPTRAWDDLDRAEHDRAFMVAGAQNADLLNDLAAAVDKSIAEGRGIDEFRRDFRSIVARNGWTGWTGEGSVKGEAWRVGVIYRTNMYSSYAAGRLAQLRAANFKFWVYRHGGSLEPRPEHLSWDGIALPPDHPFWQTHYPPSDWGCSCYVVGARSEAGVRRLGGDPDKVLPDGWDAIDPRTGTLPGVGRGWDYAPGDSVSDTVQAMANKIRNWDYAIGKAYMQNLPAATRDALANSYRALPSTADDARRYARAIAEGRAPAGNAPVRTLGMVPTDQAARIEELTGEALPGFDIQMTQGSVRHVLAEHGNPAIEISRGQRVLLPADFALLPQIISLPDSIDGPFRSAANEVLVRYVKRIGGEQYTAMFAVHRRNRSLTLKTMYVGVVRDGGAPSS